MTVIERPGYDDRTVKGLRKLTTPEGDPLTPEGHATCPGHVAWIAREWNGIRAVYGCREWRVAGHRDRTAHASGRTPAADLDETAREKARTERREVVGNNRAWKSAEAVRRDWLTTFLARRAAPRGSAAYIATEIASDAYALGRATAHGHDLALALLGIEPHVTSDPTWPVLADCVRLVRQLPDGGQPVRQIR